jgi:Relaxase/Mobilisation nuclease domain
MVPVIDTTEDMIQVLNYNEKKVQRNKAVLIHAGNFLKEKGRLNFYDKAERFQRMNELHPGSKVNMLHVSVNFHPSEKISPELITAISEKYMQGIGLPDQPFLVYQHFDAAHPHFHIVTNLIRADGSRLRTNNLGKNQSRKTADAIEKEYGLVRAKDQKKQLYELKPIDVQKLQYGKSELKKSIQQVLNHVLNEYKVGSLPELNAILSQYNVLADRGGAHSRIYANGGLMYKVLNENGTAVGIPIKASDFYFKPTLNNLEKKFEQDIEIRKQFLGGIKTRIDWTLRGQPGSLEELKSDLLKEGIELVIRQNKQEVIYGMTYIDYKTKTVVNGSDLGKLYSAKGLLEALKLPQIPATVYESAKEQKPSGGKDHPTGQESPTGKVHQADQSDWGHPIKTPQLIADLLKPEEQPIQLPYELKKRKKRKRGR